MDPLVPNSAMRNAIKCLGSRCNLQVRGGEGAVTVLMFDTIVPNTLSPKLTYYTG